MAQQEQNRRASEPENSRRRERAERILDAAATLILRWGFQKMTLDDVSRQAGVAKGTMYLHWKTREELFKALVRRERLAMAEDIRERIMADPEGSTLHGVLKHSALSLLKHPLMKAIVLRDMDILGKLANGEQSTAHLEKLLGFKTYLAFLREHGLVRTDLSLQAQIYMFSAIFMGFFSVASLMPNEFSFSDEELADLMADAVQHALEAGNPVSDETLQMVSHTFMQYLDQAIAVTRAQFEQELM